MSATLRGHDGYLDDLQQIQQSIRWLRGDAYQQANKGRYISYVWDELHRLGADDPDVMRSWVWLCEGELGTIAAMLATVERASSSAHRDARHGAVH